jgi:hypothetical protein
MDLAVSRYVFKRTWVQLIFLPFGEGDRWSRHIGKIFSFRGTRGLFQDELKAGPAKFHHLALKAILAMRGHI